MTTQTTGSLLTTATRLEVLDVLARYNHAVDLSDPEGFAACYAQDGVLTISDGTRVVGRTALEAYARAVGAAYQERHWTTSVAMRADGATVRARSYLAIFEFDDERSIGVTFTAIVDDEFVQVDEEWLVSHRHVQVDPWVPLEAVALPGFSPGVPG